MKRNTWQAAAFLGILLTAVTAVGQSAPVLEADIPFPFVVAGHTLPAGHYAVSPHGERVIQIVNSHNQATFALTFRAERGAPESLGKLVFNRYADTYVLAQVWGPGKSTGKQLCKSRLEKELENEGINREIAVLQAER